MNLEAFLIVQETARLWLGIELQTIPIRQEDGTFTHPILFPRDEYVFYKVARDYADSLSCR